MLIKVRSARTMKVPTVQFGNVDLISDIEITEEIDASHLEDAIKERQIVLDKYVAIDLENQRKQLAKYPADFFGGK